MENEFEKLAGFLTGVKARAQSAAVKGVGKAAKLIEADAKKLAPVDTGLLRESITGSAEAAAGGAVALVGSIVRYASYVEFGTGQRGESGQGENELPEQVKFRQDWTGTAPQPYLRPALAFHRDSGNIQRIIAGEIRKAMKK